MSDPTTKQSHPKDSEEASADPLEFSPAGETTGGESQNGEELLAQVRGDLDRFRDLAHRSQADFENFRKRAIREKEDAVKYANTTFLERLIPILDNFELGLNAARTGAEGSPILQGMEMVAKQISEFLLQSGVEPVSAEGEKFDPNLHEAVAQEESGTVPEGHIIRQLRKGYKLKDRLLRPATVITSKGSSH